MRELLASCKILAHRYYPIGCRKWSRWDGLEQCIERVSDLGRFELAAVRHYQKASIDKKQA